MPLAEGKTAIADFNARLVEEKLDGPITYTPLPYMDVLLRDKHYVYIFSVFPEEKKVAKGVLGIYKIPGCGPNQRVSEPMKIPAIVMSSYFDAASQSMKTDIMKGEVLAQDIVRPFTVADWSVGNILEDFGVFWTRNEVPTEAEVTAARARLDKTFRRQLQEATRLETTDQLEFITPLMRLAATHFKEDRAWNRIYKKMEVCYACGGDVRAGVIMHSCGAVMPGKWAMAIQAGLKTLAQAEAAGVDLEAENAKSAPKSPKGAKKEEPKA
jgi:hypothetical protein